MDESLRDTALRLAKEAGKKAVAINPLVPDVYGTLVMDVEELETLVRLAVAEGMERAAAKSERMVNGKGVAAAIRKMKEELK